MIYLRRLVRVLVLVFALVILVPEYLFYFVRWFITGKTMPVDDSYGYSLIEKCLNENL